MRPTPTRGHGRFTVRTPPAAGGFTLIELMIVVALVAIIIVLAGPSVRDMVEMQRLRSTSAQLVTDIQFARSEAASRQRPVYIDFTPAAAGMSCYIVHTCSGAVCQCSCEAAEGSRCTAAGAMEVKTTQVKTDTAVKVSPVGTPAATPAAVWFDPATGDMSLRYTNVFAAPPPLGTEARIDTALIRAGTPPTLRTTVGATGRPTVCSPGGLVSGVPACPP